MLKKATVEHTVRWSFCIQVTERNVFLCWQAGIEFLFLFVGKQVHNAYLSQNAYLSLPHRAVSCLKFSSLLDVLRFDVILCRTHQNSFLWIYR